ncbi:MAG: STAS domain-containing protein [Verrucomicrobiae bacterium]|nr:STAS domain-containing protein [Verrucomicrobiae bacterium]
MTIESRTEADGTLVLVPQGDTLDMANAAAFRADTSPLIAAAAGGVTVDCSNLEFIDSSGVGAFLHANKLLPEERRPIRLTAVGSKVLTLLELMHVHRSFQIQTRE